MQDLGTYLQSLLHDESGAVTTDPLETGTYKSELRKCIRVYDFMRYRYAKSPGLH